MNNNSKQQNSTQNKIAKRTPLGENLPMVVEICTQLYEGYGIYTVFAKTERPKLGDVSPSTGKEMNMNDLGYYNQCKRRSQAWLDAELNKAEASMSDEPVPPPVIEDEEPTKEEVVDEAPTAPDNQQQPDQEGSFDNTSGTYTYVPVGPVPATDPPTTDSGEGDKIDAPK